MWLWRVEACDDVEGTGLCGKWVRVCALCWSLLTLPANTAVGCKAVGCKAVCCQVSALSYTMLLGACGMRSFTKYKPRACLKLCRLSGRLSTLFHGFGTDNPACMLTMAVVHRAPMCMVAAPRCVVISSQGYHVLSSAPWWSWLTASSRPQLAPRLVLLVLTLSGCCAAWHMPHWLHMHRPCAHCPAVTDPCHSSGLVMGAGLVPQRPAAAHSVAIFEG